MSSEVPFRKLHFHKGAELIEEGRVSEYIYLIVSGLVEIRKGKVSETPKTLGRREAGQVIGEMSMLDNEPAMASAIALTDVEVCAMSFDEFHKRLDAMDPILKAMFSMAIERNREMGRLLTKMNKNPSLI